MKRSKTKRQLMEELNDARHRLAEFEAMEPERRMVGEALRAAQARLQQLLLSSPAVIYVCKAGGDYGVTFMSENVTPQLGYDTREFIDDSAFWVNRIHPEDAPRVLAELARLLELGDYVLEYRFLHKDGTYRWMRDECRLVPDGDGNPLEIVGFWIDITERKRIEEALRESEATARALLDAPTDLVLLLDTDGVIVDANQAVTLRFDKTREELVGLSIWDLFEPETAVRRKAFVDRVIRSGEPIQFEDEREGKWWDCINYPIHDLMGKVSRVAVFARDITERKLAEDALRNSERRLADIINFLPDATFAIDREGRVLAWNQAMEEMTGLRADEVLGKGNYEYAIPFYGERRPLLADFLLKPDQVPAGQYTVIARHEDTLVAENFLPSLRGGTYLWAKARLLYDSQGTAVGAIESMRDITALKQAEHALRESEQTYRNIIENAVEGIFQATPEGRYLSVNRAWATMCGFTSPEEMIREVTDIARQLYVNPEDRTRIKRLYEDPGFVKEFETQFRRKDGSLIWVSVTARSVRDSNGAVLYYEGIIQDISERKRAQEKLEQTTRTLNERVKELRCLNSISKLIERQDLSIAERVRSVVELIPSAYQYPEITCARVVIDRQQFETANFRKSCWGQRAEIFTYGKSAGSLEVCYLSEAPEADEGPFLKEERDLIGMIAENLGRMLERKQAEEERQAYQHHLQSLASDLLFTEERERRRFAIDLHDSIGQVLAMTKLKLDMLQAQVSSPELTRDLDEARQFVGQAIQQTRSLTFELSPPVLYEVGLEAALEDLVERVEERHGVQINFTDDRRSKPLNEDLRIYLFRAVRELLVNIVKHAKARSARVAVGRRDDQIRIEVADDGVGFEKSDLNSHVSNGGKFGLFSIKERLQHLGGRLEIVSEPGGGTKVVLLAPAKSTGIPGP